MEPTAEKRWLLVTDLLTIYILNGSVWSDSDRKDEINKSRLHSTWQDNVRHAPFTRI